MRILFLSESKCLENFEAAFHCFQFYSYVSILRSEALRLSFFYFLKLFFFKSAFIFLTFENHDMPILKARGQICNF